MPSKSRTIIVPFSYTSTWARNPDSKCRSSSYRNERRVIWKCGKILSYSIYISFTLFPCFFVTLQGASDSGKS